MEKETILPPKPAVNVEEPAVAAAKKIDEIDKPEDRRTEAKVVRFAEPPVSFVKSISAESNNESPPDSAVAVEVSSAAVGPAATKSLSFGFAPLPSNAEVSTATNFGLTSATTTTSTSFSFGLTRNN